MIENLQNADVKIKLASQPAETCNRINPCNCNNTTVHNLITGYGGTSAANYPMQVTVNNQYEITII